jgi:WD40 repeat protein
MNRVRCWLVLLPSLALLAVAAPPRAGEVEALLEQLADDDRLVRQRAAQKLEALDEDALDALRKTSASHPDVDVRLRAAVIARTIEERHWGEVKAFGPGVGTNLGYWFNRVAFVPGGKHALVAGGAVILFDLNSGAEVHRVLEVTGARRGLAVARDGKHALTAHGREPFFHLVEISSLKTVQTFSGHTSGVFTVDLSPDGKKALSVSGDATVRLWDVETGKELRQRVVPGRGPLCAAYSPDGKRVLVGYHGNTSEETVVLLDDTLAPLRSFIGHDGNLTAVAFLPDGTKGLSTSLDGTVRLWDLDKGTELFKMNHPGGVHHVAVSPDGRRALSAGYGDRTVRLWDLRTGKNVRAFEGHSARVLGVAFSPDGRQALSSDANACVRLWKLGK